MHCWCTNKPEAFWKCCCQKSFFCEALGRRTKRRPLLFLYQEEKDYKKCLEPVNSAKESAPYNFATDTFFFETLKQKTLFKKKLKWLATFKPN